MKTMEMNISKIHLLKLEKGEELLASILSYIKQNNIQAGFINGIGALEKGTIGYFDVKKKKYIHLPFSEVELLSCAGNIAKNKDTKEPIAHIHLVLAKEDGHSIGGHLVEAIVSVTAEIVIIETRPGVYRQKDDLTGLYLLNPKD